MLFSPEEMEICKKCKNENGCSGISRVHCLNNEHSFFEPLTNADRIRAMSDEELAEWLDLYCPDTEDSPCRTDDYFTGRRCEDCRLDWLKRPVEVEK